MLKTLAFCPSPHARTRPHHEPSFAHRLKAPAPAFPLREVLSARAPDDASDKPVDFAKDTSMPEVIFTGPAGRLEGRYHPAKQKNAPIAMILHPHPQFHGTINHQIVYQCYYAFAHRGFSVLRFNFRGVGRSQGSFDHGTGELSDAASALDWAQTINPGSARLLGRRLLVRRLDRHAAFDAPAGGRRFHFDRAARQSL